MRVARPLFVVLCASACGASPSPASSPSEQAQNSDPVPAAAASTQDAMPAETDAEDWATDSKHGAGSDTATSDAPVDKPSGGEPSGAGAKAPETRTMEVIRKLVLDNRKAARKCYETARANAKDLQGNVVIHFVLDPEGKVKLAELNQERSTLKAPAVVDCVIDVIKGISFPRSSRAMETNANYPFNFTP